MFGAVISILPLRSPLKLPATLTVCKQSKRGKIVSFTVTCRSDLKKKKDTNSAGSPKILRNLASKRKCDLEPCKSILSKLHRSFQFQKKEVSFISNFTHQCTFAIQVEQQGRVPQLSRPRVVDTVEQHTLAESVCPMGERKRHIPVRRAIYSTGVCCQRGYI